jgi:hypothetical protein
MKNLLKCLIVVNILFVTHQTMAQCVKGSLLSVRTVKIGAYNYVTFKFKGHHVPPFTIQNATPPFVENPSDNPITVNGCKYKRVIFKGGAYCAVVRYMANLPLNVVKGVKSTEQFEGNYEYVIGYRCSAALVSHYSIKTGPNWKMVLKFK